MHCSSSKSGGALAPVPRGPDACQMITRAQLGQDPPQRTVLGVLTENGQYRRTCGQVMTELLWRLVVEEGCHRGRGVSFGVLPINTLEYSSLGIWTIGTLVLLKITLVPFPAGNSE